MELMPCRLLSLPILALFGSSETYMHTLGETEVLKKKKGPPAAAGGGGSRPTTVKKSEAQEGKVKVKVRGLLSTALY